MGTNLLHSHLLNSDISPYILCSAKHYCHSQSLWKRQTKITHCKHNSNQKCKIFSLYHNRYLL